MILMPAIRMSGWQADRGFVEGCTRIQGNPMFVSGACRNLSTVKGAGQPDENILYLRR